MFSFLKKFKSSSGDEHDKEKSASPATPARSRRAKSSSPESEEVAEPEDASSLKLDALEQQVLRLETDKRSLVNQETKFQEQLADLTAQLSARDNETNRLRYQMEDLQRDVLIKGSGVDRLQAELDAAHRESELVRRRLRQLEEDLTLFKQRNRELQDELQKKAEETEESSEEEESEDERVSELETTVQQLENNVRLLEQKVQELQAQLEQVRGERDNLEKQRAAMEAERNEEMKIVQLALEEALEEKALIKCQFEQDFEKLRTVNTDREQQLLDDFEWKLREVEQACKRRLEDKDKEKKDLNIKLKLAEQQLAELPHLKAFEAECKQLRGLTLEQQKSLRATSRQADQLQVSERVLKDDVSRLKTQLEKEKTHVICIESLNEKRLADAEKKFQARLDTQKSDLTAQWEDRLRRECSRLKAELDQLHREEKHLAVESVKVQKDQEMCTAKQGWERRVDNFLKEISALKDQLTEKDTFYHEELEKAQTNADRDIFDLRRKLDKIDLSYQEQMEKLNEKHEKEIEQLNWESERKIQQLEQNWQLQMSSTRATLELVKEQMERDAQDRLDTAHEQHRKQLDMQWERLTSEKDRVVAELEEKMRTKGASPRESELLETIVNLKKQLQGQTGVISDLQGNVDMLQGGMQVLNQEITSHTHDMQRVQAQAAHKIRELEAEQRKKLVEMKERFVEEKKQLQEQTKTMHDQYQNKMNYLIKLLRDTDQKYRNRESRKEDLEQIVKLKQELEARDSKVTSLSQENKFYQLQLKSSHHAPRKKPQRWRSCSELSAKNCELVECHRHFQVHPVPPHPPSTSTVV